MVIWMSYLYQYLWCYRLCLYFKKKIIRKHVFCSLQISHLYTTRTLQVSRESMHPPAVCSCLVCVKPTVMEFDLFLCLSVHALKAYGSQFMYQYNLYWYKSCWQQNYWTTIVLIHAQIVHMLVSLLGLPNCIVSGVLWWTLWQCMHVVCAEAVLIWTSTKASAP